jgi:hypothetical protein
MGLPTGRERQGGREKEKEKEKEKFESMFYFLMGDHLKLVNVSSQRTLLVGTTNRRPLCVPHSTS